MGTVHCQPDNRAFWQSVYGRGVNMLCSVCGMACLHQPGIQQQEATRHLALIMSIFSCSRKQVLQQLEACVLSQPSLFLFACKEFVVVHDGRLHFLCLSCIACSARYYQ